jgi:hypothetical protein
MVGGVEARPAKDLLSPEVKVSVTVVVTTGDCWIIEDVTMGGCWIIEDVI